MKRVLLVMVALFIGASSFAQILKPVKWSYAAKRVGKDEAVILLKATIDGGWHMYSQTVKDGGPVKTTITMAPSKDYTLIGKTQEPKAITKYEDTFKMNVAYFEREVVFQQRVKLNKSTATVKGKVEFMVCDDKQCLPPDEVDFSVQVKPAAKK